MFIDWATQLQLLQHDPAQNILKNFVLPVKKIMVSQVVTFLLDGVNFKTLSSPSHVIYAMETCGQGFSLPIEEEESITKVINLYALWALEKGKRPSSIDEDLQFFLQRILSHFSLLFEPRAQAKELVEKHAMLCSRVLDIFAQIGRIVGPKMSIETWELFLKLLIAIADSILRPEAPANQEPLQRKLCAQLLKVLFELWLLSRTKNPYLWNALKQRLQTWTHHMALIITWIVTSIALTRRSLAILYGNAEGTENVQIKFDDQQINLNLEDDYVYYSWHRMLNIVGNPNHTINNPAIYLAFITGVEDLVNLYLKIGTQSKKTRYLPPTGNTLFHIFGSWLFDSVHLDRNGFDEGTALSLKIISSIIAAKFKLKSLLPVYISSYYSSLQSALSKEGRVLLAAITSSTTLFTYEIKGIRSLVPYFVGGIQRVLTKRAGGFEIVMPSEQVRKYCLTILSTIICLPNHFNETPFTLRAKDKQSKSFDVENYTSLKKVYTTMIIDALTSETNATNIEILLNITQIWQAEDIEFSSEFTKNSIALILRKITTPQAWTPEVCLLGIKSLSSMSNLYSKIENGHEQANLIATSLCKHLQTFLTSPLNDKISEEIVVQLFRCVTDWCMTDQWLFSFPETKMLLFKTIVMGLRGPTPLLDSKDAVLDPKKKKPTKKDEKAEKKDTPISQFRYERIKDTAQFTLSSVLNHTGNFPTESGASVVSTLAREEEILYKICTVGNFNPVDTKEYIRYFITDDKVIICVIDRRFGDGAGSSCVIVRDKTGRYSWDINLTYMPYKANPEVPPFTNHDISIPICSNPVSPADLISPSMIGEITHYLSSQPSKNAFKLVEHQVVSEQKLLKQNKFRLDLPISISIPKPADPYIGDSKIQQSRVLLSHLGMLSLEHRDKMYPLQMNESFFNSLKTLDQLPERECIKTAVVYIRKGQSEEEYLANEGGSLDYQEFIASLGWGVKLSSHMGYLGSLEPQFSTVAPYWSNYSTEIIFHVTTLIGNSPSFPDHLHKKRQILGALVVVVWAEDQTDFQPQLWARCRHNIVFVIISPLEHGLYFVKVLSKNDLSGVGPLLDGAVVSKTILGYLVRETSITAYRKENFDAETPYQQRSLHLENMLMQYKKETSLEQFYTSIFTSLSADQIGPTPQQVLPNVPFITPTPSSSSNPSLHAPSGNNSNNNNNNSNSGNSGSSNNNSNNNNANANSPSRSWGKPPTNRPESSKKEGWLNTNTIRNSANTGGRGTSGPGSLTLGDQRDKKADEAENELGSSDDIQPDVKEEKSERSKDKEKRGKSFRIKKTKKSKKDAQTPTTEVDHSPDSQNEF